MCIRDRDPDDLDVASRIALGADVVVDNFRVGTMARFGLDRDSLAERRPDLITCSVTGFGSTGKGAELAGYDFLVQAMSGVMAITGRAEGEPTKVGSAVVDKLTGLYAAIAILAAVEERRVSGLGQHVEVSLMGSALAGLLNVGSSHVVAGTDPVRQGNRHPSIVPYQPYRTADGVLAVAAVLHRCPALTSLDLCGNAALNAGARAVAAAVTHPGCGLRSVAMTFNMTAREWSASGLEDCIRLLHSALPHSRLTSLRLLSLIHI